MNAEEKKGKIKDFSSNQKGNVLISVKKLFKEPRAKKFCQCGVELTGRDCWKTYCLDCYCKNNKNTNSNDFVKCCFED